MTMEFRRIDPARARVLLIQSGPRLLPAFPEPLSREAERALAPAWGRAACSIAGSRMSARRA